MIKHENFCVDCNIQCIGVKCPYVNVPVYVCDKCGEETFYHHEYIEYEDMGLCRVCYENLLEERSEEE